jgi:1-acyl-sn-glycerol-3-phosphate acyltransferase
MFSFSKITQKSLLYTILKFFSDLWHNYFFYKKVSYIGLENIPTNKSVIIGPNHQNALMDAIAIIASKPYNNPVFLARSDIFKGNIISSFLIKMKILPIYRIRDGKDKLKKNEEIFDETVKIYKQKKH